MLTLFSPIVPAGATAVNAISNSAQGSGAVGIGGLLIALGWIIIFIYIAINEIKDPLLFGGDDYDG